MLVQIVLFDGFDELDAIAPYEVLCTAAALGADLQVQLVTLDGAEEVQAQHGLRVRPHTCLAERPDVVLVPGGGWNARRDRGAWGEAQRGTIPAALARRHAAGSTIATVCAGGMLASAAGLTSGRPAITHHLAVDDLRAAGAEVIQARVVDDGDLVSAGGITSGLDLGLWLVERFCGAPMAARVEASIEYERRGTVWRRAER
jgi:transcriptional regulator GlxA family with amidase domain